MTCDYPSIVFPSDTIVVVVVVHKSLAFNFTI